MMNAGLVRKAILFAALNAGAKVLGDSVEASPGVGKGTVKELLEAEIAEARAKATPEGETAEASGWWGEVPKDDGEARETGEDAITRMNAMLRRALDEEAEAEMGLSYLYTDVPSIMPTPLPSPIPTTLGNCPEGTSAYELALYDYGGDGWEGAQYTLSQMKGLKAPVQIDVGTLLRGNEAVVDFCLEDGTYVVDFGSNDNSGSDGTGIQWLPDDTQKITTCRGPCVDVSMMVGGVVMDATGAPTPSNYNQPTAFDASQHSHHVITVTVDGVDDDAFTPDEIGLLVIQHAFDDALEVTSGPEAIVSAEVAVQGGRRHLLQAGDRTATIEVTIDMDTCAEAGFNSNDECLAGLVANINAASESGFLAERILYWANYFGMTISPDVSVTGVTPGTEPEWVYPDTHAPTPKPHSASSKKSKKSGSAVSNTELIIIIVCCVLGGLLLVLLGLYFKQRERKATERKDSWDISTMFTDENNLPDSNDMVADPGGASVAASATGKGDQPQALQKITQAAEL